MVKKSVFHGRKRFDKADGGACNSKKFLSGKWEWDMFTLIDWQRIAIKEDGSPSHFSPQIGNNNFRVRLHIRKKSRPKKKITLCFFFFQTIKTQRDPKCISACPFACPSVRPSFGRNFIWCYSILKTRFNYHDAIWLSSALQRVIALSNSHIRLKIQLNPGWAFFQGTAQISSQVAFKGEFSNKDITKAIMPSTEVMRVSSRGV